MKISNYSIANSALTFVGVMLIVGLGYFQIISNLLGIGLLVGLAVVSGAILYRLASAGGEHD
jgi:hypothetical protein